MVVDGKTKILFVHHTAMWFRRPFFHDLSKFYDVEFIFTNVESYNKTYDTQFSQSNIPGMDDLNYRVINKRLGIAWGAIRRAMGEYDIFPGDDPADHDQCGYQKRHPHCPDWPDRRIGD